MSKWLHILNAAILMAVYMNKIGHHATPRCLLAVVTFTTFFQLEYTHCSVLDELGADGESDLRGITLDVIISLHERLQSMKDCHQLWLLVHAGSSGPRTWHARYRYHGDLVAKILSWLP